MMMFRHGDVLVMKVDEIPSEVKKLDHRVLAYGEVTGHAHRLDVGELFETRNGELYLKMKKAGKLSHEEHNTINIPKGNYRVVHQREYTPEAIRRVLD